MVFRYLLTLNHLDPMALSTSNGNSLINDKSNLNRRYCSTSKLNWSNLSRSNNSSTPTVCEHPSIASLMPNLVKSGEKFIDLRLIDADSGFDELSVDMTSDAKIK